MNDINRLKGIIVVCLLFCTSLPMITASPLGPDNAYTWSIPNDQLAITPGSIITNAVLTIHNASVNGTTGNETLYVHLLDNPDPDVETYNDGQSEDYFEGYGVYLSQFRASDFPASPSDIIIELAQVNDPDSPVWSVFERPFTVTLADSSQAALTSSLLTLLDYAGTGSSFGFGFDCDSVTFDGLSLELTVQSMTDIVPETTLSFAYGNVHSPVIQPIPDQSINAEQTLSFTVTATDEDNDVLTYSAENLPPGASCVNGIFTWTPSTAQIGIYDVLFTANDGKGGLDTTIVQITVNPAADQWTVLAYDDFESGWGNYTDGGNYCSLYTRTKYAPQGNNAACIENGGGDASSFVLTNGIDVKTPGYSEINIAFSYIAVSMDNSREGFRLDYWDGTKWLTLKSWRRYLDFENNRVYSEAVKIYGSNVVFPTNMKIRFVCEASDNIDLVMIDEIAISAK